MSLILLISRSWWFYNMKEVFKQLSLISYCMYIGFIMLNDYKNIFYW